MYVYYRATDTLEATYLDNNDQLPYDYGVTYWTDGLEPAELYKGEGRVIVKITLSRPIPSVFFGIAEGVDENGNMNNHREWIVPKAEFNESVLAHLEEVEVIR